MTNYQGQWLYTEITLINQFEKCEHSRTNKECDRKISLSIYSNKQAFYTFLDDNIFTSDYSMKLILKRR